MFPQLLKITTGIPLIIFLSNSKPEKIAGLQPLATEVHHNGKVNGKSLWGIDRGVDDGPSEMEEHWGGQPLLIGANTSQEWGDRSSTGPSCKTYWVDWLWWLVWPIFPRYCAFILLPLNESRSLIVLLFYIGIKRSLRRMLNTPY